MQSFAAVASQLGLLEGARRLKCLSPDWETSLSRPTGKAPIEPHAALVPAQMIERVIATRS
jgi:hypothetical protein